MKIIPIKRALISVSNKSGIVEFAAALHAQNIEIISTGGTSQVLRDAHIPHKQAEDVTGFPEMLDGRVKTLHPHIHGGILGKRDQHAEEAAQHGIEWIDLVVVNFYPFSTVVKHDTPLDKAVEMIDIGGPTMVRAAAKNIAWVGVVTDPADYVDVIKSIQENGGLSLAMRLQFVEKAFRLTSQYDAMIQQYFAAQQINSEIATDNTPSQLHLTFTKSASLRYGENPHQQASAYHLSGYSTGVLAATQHQGKPLSYNNILDTEAAVNCVAEFSEPACVIVKHANPCGAATSVNIDDAYQQAYAADSLSAFGGIVALNRPCTKLIAESIAGIFMEVVVAPAFTDEALAIFATKPNLRLLAMPIAARDKWEMRHVTGGVLLQEADTHVIHDETLDVVTNTKPTAAELQSMTFAWRVLKHIKSNGILLAKDNATVGVGAGQVSRIDAVDLAIRKAGENGHQTILASDAFFPFRDSIDRIASAGIRAIIQPGGSVRDDEVIAACNEHNIAMVFTGTRCFKH